MASSRKTQKQLSEKYKDNLARYKRLYTGRRAILTATWFAIIAAVVAVWYYHNRAPDKFFNPGPVSSHHLNITPAMLTGMSSAESNRPGSSNCDACHDKSLAAGDGLTTRKFVQVVRESLG